MVWNSYRKLPNPVMIATFAFLDIIAKATFLVRFGETVAQGY